MNKVVKEGKNLEELLNEVLSELKVTKEELLYKKVEKKGGLFKGASIIIEATTIKEVEKYLKEYLNELLTKMGITASFESKIRDNQIIIKMYSDQNPILIGKNGQTLKALETICKQVIYNEMGTYPYISLDVENYKDKQIKRIEHLAKNVAKDVAKTKVAAKLDCMNSYERRIVHNVLTNFKGVYTESIGEEPNRCVVIKPDNN